MRLSTRGNAVSGTMYSPGMPPPSGPLAGWMRPDSTPSGPAVVSAAALSVPALADLPAGTVSAFFAESPPRSCSTADGLPVRVPVSPFTPRPRSVRSMAGSAFSSAPVLSVMRNSRNALRCTMDLARAGSVIPASSTTIRLSPAFCTTGSSTPNSSMRLRSTVSARSRSFLGSADTCFDWSSSSARCIPPWRSSPRLSGTRVTVSSCMTPSAPRTRSVTVRGNRK